MRILTTIQIYKNAEAIPRRVYHVYIRGKIMLTVNDLTKSFGSGSNRLDVLKGVDMSITKGEMVALMGPSGCGKSTLLNIIGGLLSADSGDIDLEGRTYGRQKPSEVVDIRRKGVGWIFQDFHLVPSLSAKDNVAMALELCGYKSEEAEELSLIHI